MNPAPGPGNIYHRTFSWQNRSVLVFVKALHTIVWVFFVVCIAGVPIFAHIGRFDLSAISFIIVLIEVAVLAANGMRCPLTDVAARYTDERRANFDIYLPLTIARYNKHIFGPLFLIGTIYALLVWARIFG